MIAGKRKICYIEVSDFTNIQVVGNNSIYKRYDSVYAIIKKYINEEYWDFLAEPEYSEGEDKIYWYVDEWDSSIQPIKFNILDSNSRLIFEENLKEVVNHYKFVCSSLSGNERKILESAIKFIDKNFVYCIGNKVLLAVWGMEPDEFRHNPSGTIIHELDLTDSYNIHFNPGEHGSLPNKLEERVRRKSGCVLSHKDLPTVKPKEGYEFICWEPEPIGKIVKNNLTFNATYKAVEIPPKQCNVKFTSDENSQIDGIDSVFVVEGTALTSEQIPNVLVSDNYNFIGWDKDVKSIINDNITFKALTEKVQPETCHVRFSIGENYGLLGNVEFDIPKGSIFPKEFIPGVKCNERCKFVRWSEDLSLPITSDLDINAIIDIESDDAEKISINFDAAEHGTLIGTSSYLLSKGSKLIPGQIPNIKANSGYKFINWDKEPLDIILDNDTTFTAIYEERLPWWKRFLLWIRSLGGCLLRLMYFLLLLLLFIFLLSLIRQCDNGRVLDEDDIKNGPALVEIGDSTHNHLRDNPGFADDGQIGDTPSTPIDNPDLGEGINPGNGDNEYHVGILPPNPSIPPIDNPDNPQGPQIIPNVINVFFTDDNANLNAFAQDFRDIYPDTQKYLMDYDDLVKRISIMMPAEERVSMKKEIEKRLGKKYSFFIVDEFAIQHSQSQLTSIGNPSNEATPGWHLLAVNAPKAWTITVGSPDITVAVVDDGFDTSHDFLKDKIVEPYNVFTKTQELSNGAGHGTHTAGLAVGLVRKDGKAAGIAPGCKLMPIQVFYEDKSTISAEVSGIAYAIHKGADVVNISMGCSFAGFRNVPPDEQIAIAKQKGTVEELLWKRVYKMAKDRNTVLVFSAGNDNVISYLNPQNRPDSIISVTAVDYKFQKSIFNQDGAGSDYGLGSTIAAPGSDIYSSVPINDYAMMQGTSMAAPIVTGVVALLKSVKKDISIGETIDILQRSGKSLSDKTLGPLVQADRALVLLQTGSLPPDEANDDNKDDDKDENNKDYSHIFQQISEHQKAIIELIKQLPPEEQKKIKK